jgi:hypothetical protein
VFLRAQPAAMGQPVFIAPSVFNYYPPGLHRAGDRRAGAGVRPAEHDQQLRAHQFRQRTLPTRRRSRPIQHVYGATGTQLDWSPLAARATDPAALVAPSTGCSPTARHRARRGAPLSPR